MASGLFRAVHTERATIRVTDRDEKGRVGGRGWKELRRMVMWNYSVPYYFVFVLIFFYYLTL